MPVQIGATTHNFQDPTGLLSDCHRRVEMFMGSLQAVASTCDRPLSDESRRALEQALRYFREAAPKHTADEEESLFPVLRQMKDDEVEAVLRKVNALEEDHRWAGPLHEIVDSIGTEYLTTGVLAPAKSADFREAVAQLSEMYRRHIEVEDRDVFPVAARKLSSEQKAKIGKEMADRRSVHLRTP